MYAKRERIDWDAIEVEYSANFKSGRGRPAVSARKALGALIIQKRTGLSDRKLVAEVARNVSYQYFLGLQAFQPKSPFKHGVLSEFRKRIGVRCRAARNPALGRGSRFLWADTIYGIG